MLIIAVIMLAEGFLPVFLPYLIPVVRNGQNHLLLTLCFGSCLLALTPGFPFLFFITAEQ